MGMRIAEDPFRLEVPGTTFERCFSETAFSYVASRLLNKFPASMKELDSIVVFKSKLKTFLFVRAFDLLVSDESVNESCMCAFMS